MHVQLIRAGNFLPLTLSVLPTGEKQRTTCKGQTYDSQTTNVKMMPFLTLSCLLTRSMKNFQQFSLVSCSPAPLTSFLTIVTMFST